MLLALLRLRPMHGYELMAELRARMGRAYRASPGSIYPAVQALEEEGLIEGRLEDDRRVYALTAAGRQALERRVDRLSALEARLGVSFSSGVEAALSRLIRAARSSCADPAAVEAELERAAANLETLGRRR